MRIISYTQPAARNLAPLRGSIMPNPWLGLDAEIGRFFNEALVNINALPMAYDRFPVDLYEDKNNTYVRAELPGVNRADINVEVVDDYLTITASRKADAGDNAESFSMSRSVLIPDSAQADKVSASLENGVLTVTLPKREEAKPRKINVSVN
jgi:HSP20 family protein